MGGKQYLDLNDNVKSVESNEPKQHGDHVERLQEISIRKPELIQKEEGKGRIPDHRISSYQKKAHRNI